MPPRNYPPDVSNLVIASAQHPYRGAYHGRARGRSPDYLGPGFLLDAGRGSDSTINTIPQDDPYVIDDVRIDEGRYEEPHRSTGFWDPRMQGIRKQVAYEWARMLLILVLYIMAILCMYWAVLFHVNKNMVNITVHVVDFDGQVAPYDYVTPLVGPAVTDVVEQMRSMQPTLGYTIVPPEHYNYDPIAVRQAVYDWHAWAAIIINPNATALLQEAVATGNASYNPIGAIQFIIQSARQETVHANYIVPQLQTIARNFAAQFGPSWTQSVMTNDSLSLDVLTRVPAAINPGVTPLTIDLRPFGPATATPAVTIGLIYLIIVAFFSFAFFLPIHMKFVMPGAHPPLHYWQLIIMRICATVTTYFFVSLIYSLVSLAYQIPFWPPPASQTEPAFNATAYGRGSFVVYWMVNFLGMNALGIACENVAQIVGQPWTAAWLIFWVITNVATSFNSIELAPGFFKWGYAWPLHHIVQASRQILFDLHSEIGLNLGVLFAWAALNLALFPVCCYFGRWKMDRQRRSAERNAESYAVYDAAAEGQKKHVPKEKGVLPPIRKRGFMRGW